MSLKKIVIPSLVIAASVLIIVVATRPPRKEQSYIDPPWPKPIGIIDSATQRDQRVRQLIEEAGYSLNSSDGIRNYLSPKYDDNTPLIELRFFTRELDGTIQPLNMLSAGIFSHDPNAAQRSGSTYGIRGIGWRTEVHAKRTEIENLIFGRTYNVGGNYHEQNDPNRPVLGTSKARFTIPKSLEPGEIFKVDLILVDKIRKKKLAAQRQAEARERKQRVIDETLTVTIPDPPDFATDQGFFYACYSDGEHSREFYEQKSQAKGLLELKGPNKLGGDLMVAFAAPKAHIPWAYIKNLNKRNVTLPDDATLLRTEDAFVDINISFTPSELNLPPDTKAVLLNPSEFPEPSFYWSSFALIGNPNDPSKLVLRKISALPGTYIISAILKDSSQIRMGIIEVTNEPNKTYSLPLPK